MARPCSASDVGLPYIPKPWSVCAGTKAQLSGEPEQARGLVQVLDSGQPVQRSERFAFWHALPTNYRAMSPGLRSSRGPSFDAGAALEKCYLYAV